MTDSRRDRWTASVIALAKKAGFNDGLDVRAIKGGANNRAYVVEEKGKKAFLKQYFRHPSDPRDRLKAEFGFTKFVWDSGIRSVPQPFACDNEKGLAIYEWIEGRLLMPDEVTQKHIDQALTFFLDINKNKHKAEHFGVASEACFSLKGHIETVDKRVDKLFHIPQKAAIDSKALRFIKGDLKPAWGIVKEKAIKTIQERKLSMEEELLMGDRCLSPSDFGFHNALLSLNGSLCFIDFEYAGWDDPCKMVCDFFCQPQLPAPMKSYELFVKEVVARLSDPVKYLTRIQILLPIYRIKWCCILLNNFLYVDAKRRSFANEESDRDTLKERQLHKAILLLEDISERFCRGGI